MERVIVSIKNSSLLWCATLILFASDRPFMQVATALRTPQYLARRTRPVAMSRQASAEQHLVLVGGGHAHLQVIKALNWASRPSNLRVTLIDQQKAASYSGMVPGCISKLYTPDDTLIHLKPLAEWAGIDFINDSVADIDFQKRVVNLGKRKVKFDCISIDIGSASRGLDETAGAREFSIPTRPISKLVERIDEAEKEMLRRSSQGEQRIEPEVVVLGGGAAGIELSLSIMGRWKPIFENIKVTLIDSGPELLPQDSFPSRESLYRVLRERGIHVQSKSIVREIKENCIELLVDGEQQSLPYTNCIWATGAGAHPLAWKLKGNGLDVTQHGWIKVNEHLQSTSHPFVFAAGDCCSIENLPLGPPPKAGVYAVRAGPVLIENLTNYLAKKSLMKYVPQPDFLRLVCCGDGTALGFRFGKAMHGSWVWKMKDRIDRNFMELFERDNLPILKQGAAYDTSQYDAKAVQSDDSIQPYRAAAMLFESNDDVDYEEAWGLLRYMAQNEEYREEVLKYHDEFAQVLK